MVAEHWPGPRGFAPRGEPHHGYSGGNQRRGNGGGNYNNHSNAYRSRRANYNNNYHQNQYRPRPQRPIFQQPMPYYGPPQIGSYTNMMGFGVADTPLQLMYIPTPFPPFQDYYRASPQVILPPQDPIGSAIQKQIEYYFSENNLCKDTYLRQNMDEGGWVPISLIAGFKRVKNLSTSIPFILDTMRNSYGVEVQGNMIRTRDDPLRWPLPPSQSANFPQYHNTLESQMKNMGLNEEASCQTDAASS